MKRPQSLSQCVLQLQPRTRTGGIVVFAALLLVVILAFTAFTVDIGFIALTKAQLQNAVDSAALGAGQEIASAHATGSSIVEAEAVARAVAKDLAKVHATGDRSQIYVDPTRDIRFGKAHWDATSRTWVKEWGATPYNMVEVTAMRNEQSGSSVDGPLNLFIAPVIGNKTANLTVKSTVVVPAGIGVGLRRPPRAGAGTGVVEEETCLVLPFVIDEPSWNDLMAGVGGDSFTHVPNTNTVTNGPDGIAEFNIYPSNNPKLPSGNRGTLNIGSGTNATPDIARQIMTGLNATDMQYYPNYEIRFDNGPVYMTGDPGISASLEKPLSAILGQARLIPVFRTVTGQGGNSNYEIIKFVGVRVLDVQLNGNSSKKHLTVQPCPFVSPNVIRGNGPLTRDSYLAPHTLIK